MNYANLQKIRNGKRTYSITPHIQVDLLPLTP